MTNTAHEPAAREPSGGEGVRVLIADDQAMVRQGFTVLLNAEAGISVVGQAVDGHEALARAAELAPDVVLMDIRMPGMDGIEATRRLTAPAPAGAPPPTTVPATTAVPAATTVPATTTPAPAPRPPGDGAAGSGTRPVRVLVLTTFDLDEYVYEALRAGASGFLLKDASAAELAHAVRVVAAGEALLSPNVTKRLIAEYARLADGPPAPDPARASVLTEREREVLALIARGLSNGEIAGRLTVAEQTVKTHVGRILVKLALRDRTQAAIFAYESGLVRPAGGNG